MTDALGRAIRFERDQLGRMTQQSFPDGRAIQFSYDANGNLTSLTPPGRDAHIFHYDAINQTTDYDPPKLINGFTPTQYFYDLDKQLTQIMRPDGQSVDFIYDDAGRLAAMDTNPVAINYGYDHSSGQLTHIETSDNNILSFNYDGFLLVDETWTGVVSGRVSHEYSSDFWVSALSVNNNGINFEYDNDGLLMQAGNLTIDHNLANGLITGTNLSSINSSLDYNEFGELIYYGAEAAGSILYSTSFERDVLGRITAKSEDIEGNIHNYFYDYDLSGRLVNVTKDNISIAQYLYDDNGNRIGGFDPFGSITANYDAQDRLVSYNTMSFTYTANGELLSKSMGSETTQYDYDALSNLRQVILPDSTQINYVIDGENRRIGKKINGTLVQGFLYQDQLNPIVELDGNNQVVSRFVYGTKANVPDYMVKDGQNYRILSDHLGSPRLVINASTGDIVQRMDYDEFGKVIVDTNPGFQPFGFAGGVYDQHMQFTRFGARDYNAVTGRWTAKDPIRFAGGDANLYGYVLADPINLVDPSGLDATFYQQLGFHTVVVVDNPDKPGDVISIDLGPRVDVPLTSNIWAGLTGGGVPGEIRILEGEPPLSFPIYTREQTPQKDRALIERARILQRSFYRGFLEFNPLGFNLEGSATNCIGFAFDL